MGNGVVQTKISAVTFDSSQFSKVASILAPILHFIELRDNGHVPTVYFEIFGSLKEELVNLSKVNLVSNDYSQSRLGKFARMVGPLSQQIKSFGLHHSFQQEHHGSNFTNNRYDHIDYRSMGDFLATLSQLECCSIPVVSGLTEDAQSMAHLLSSLPPTLKHLYLTRVDSFSMIHLNNRWPVEPSYFQLTHLNIPAPVSLELAFSNFLNNLMNPGDVLQMINIPAQTLCIGVHYEVVEPSVHLTDLDIGDSAQADDYHDGINATSLTHNWGVYDAAPYGRYYPEADAIQLTFNTSTLMNSGKLKVTALLVPFLAD